MSEKIIPFTVDDTEFLYQRMPPERVLKGLEFVSPLFTGDVQGAMANAPELFKLFVNQTSILYGEGDAKVKKPFKALASAHYTGAPGKMVAFVMQCIQMEYSDFLPGSEGHDALQEAASPFMSLMDASGSSGD